MVYLCVSTLLMYDTRPYKNKHRQRFQYMNSGCVYTQIYHLSLTTSSEIDLNIQKKTIVCFQMVWWLSAQYYIWTECYSKFIRKSKKKINSLFTIPCFIEGIRSVRQQTIHSLWFKRINHFNRNSWKWINTCSVAQLYSSINNNCVYANYIRNS